MSMMIMFGVGAFGRFFVQEQHIIAPKKVIRVRATILPMAVQKSYEPPLQGSVLFVFVQVFSAIFAHTENSHS